MIAERHHRETTAAERLGEWGVPDRMRQHRHVALGAERCRFVPGIVDSHDGRVEESSDATADDTVSDQPGRHRTVGPSVGPSVRPAATSPIRIGRQPPCCGGVPPRPRTRMPPAATPAMISAAMILRKSRTAPSWPTSAIVRTPHRSAISDTVDHEHTIEGKSVRMILPNRATQPANENVIATVLRRRILVYSPDEAIRETSSLTVTMSSGEHTKADESPDIRPR